jgi:DNA invertase Pin-like site-specific DNA recombinase
MRQIIGAVAQYERAMIVAKLRAARERIKKQHGRCGGKHPFGSKGEESLTLARMRQLRGAGHSLESVAATLDAEGLKPRTGSRWFAASVARILKRATAEYAEMGGN